MNLQIGQQRLYTPAYSGFRRRNLHSCYRSVSIGCAGLHATKYDAGNRTAALVGFTEINTETAIALLDRGADIDAKDHTLRGNTSA